MIVHEKDEYGIREQVSGLITMRLEIIKRGQRKCAEMLKRAPLPLRTQEFAMSLGV